MSTPREYLSDDVRAVIENTQRDGEQFDEYLDRLSLNAMCGDVDAREALLGVYDTVTMKWYSGQEYKHGRPTIH